MITLSTLAQRALRDAGLDDALSAWTERRWADLPALSPGLVGKDVLALGTLADALRREHLGEAVRAHTQAGTLGPSDILVPASPTLLVDVAVARITHPPSTRVAVDLASVGPTLAQVALTFGATDLVGFLVNKRGLPLADETRRVKGEGQVPLATLKERELLRVLAVAGRPAEFVRATGTVPAQSSHGHPGGLS